MKSIWQETLTALGDLAMIIFAFIGIIVAVKWVYS